MGEDSRYAGRRQESMVRDLSRLATFPEHNPNPVLETSPDGSEVTYFNPAASQRFPELELGLGVPPELTALVDGPEAEDSEVIVVRERSYERKVFHDRAFTRIYLHDVSERRRLIRELEQTREELRVQAVRDPLTGLYNRRHMEESLGRELARALRHETPLAVIVLDVDHFKDLNDGHGHPAGDAILTEVGRILTANVRREDIACRYGGDEFVLILPGMPRGSAARRAEEIRRLVDELEVDFDGARLGTTVSVGVAVIAAETLTDERGSLRSADQAMYEAKKRGRNCVVLAPPGAELTAVI